MRWVPAFQDSLLATSKVAIDRERKNPKAALFTLQNERMPKLRQMSSPLIIDNPLIVFTSP